MVKPLSAPWRLIAYLSAIVGCTLLHQPALLALALLLALLASGRRRTALLRKSLLAILAFNLSVSLGYSAVSVWQGNFHGGTLLLLNLRVLLMVYLGFWFVASTDLLAALARFPLLQFIATLAIAQIGTLQRVIGDFQLAFASRNIVRPRLRDHHRQATAQAVCLLDKTLAASHESAQAMRSRGAFDD